MHLDALGLTRKPPKYFDEMDIFLVINRKLQEFLTPSILHHPTKELRPRKDKKMKVGINFNFFFWNVDPYFVTTILVLSTELINVN